MTQIICPTCQQDMQADPYPAVYGWFVRVERGLCALSDSGRAGLAPWKAHLPTATAEALTVAAAS